MADTQLLGLYNNVDQTADVIASLHDLGITDEQITIMSGAPYRAEYLGRPHKRGKVGCAALAGAIMGIIVATLLSIGIFTIFPVRQGGQPLVPIPPSLIVYFEVTMLGTMWAAFLGFLVLSGLPAFRSQPYDPRITAGLFGVQVNAREGMAQQIESALHRFNAVDVVRQASVPAIDKKFRMFWGSVAVGLTGLVIISLLFFYDVIPFDFPSNMVDQDSFGYEQGPRLAAPGNAIPIQGPATIADQPASQPLPTSPDSLQRGQIHYNINCLVCHGPTGNGVGQISAFFNPKPRDLTSSDVQNLTNEEIYMVITRGFGIMPPMAENLRPAERWDVVNHVRSLRR